MRQARSSALGGPQSPVERAHPFRPPRLARGRSRGGASGNGRVRRPPGLPLPRRPGRRGWWPEPAGSRGRRGRTSGCRCLDPSSERVGPGTFQAVGLAPGSLVAVLAGVCVALRAGRAGSTPPGVTPTRHPPSDGALRGATPRPLSSPQAPPKGEPGTSGLGSAPRAGRREVAILGVRGRKGAGQGSAGSGRRRPHSRFRGSSTPGPAAPSPPDSRLGHCRSLRELRSQSRSREARPRTCLHGRRRGNRALEAWALPVLGSRETRCRRWAGRVRRLEKPGPLGCWWWVCFQTQARSSWGACPLPPRKPWIGPK